MNLVLVESPTKARTLARYLGRGYQVESTMGHIRDLPSKRFGVEITVKNGSASVKPKYEIVSGKKNHVLKLKKLQTSAQAVILATDPDREGEAIAWHIAALLRGAKIPSTSRSSAEAHSKPSGSGGEKRPAKKFSRVVFHQVTKSAILKAMEHPRSINLDLVNAQQARRVLDRIVGYRLSPLLWKKIRRGLSAGRVQSVAVRLIVDRQREIEAFKADEYWEVIVEVTPSDRKDPFGVKLIKIDQNKAELSSEKEVTPVVNDLEKARYQVAAVEEKEVKRQPWAPFTTSSLQQTASRLYRWSGKKTMMIAQRLYESGYITYHRTDSLSLSREAVESVRKIIPNRFGPEFLSPSPRFYQTKSKLAQEAHEAIRPTRISQIDALTEIKERIKRMGQESIRLYELIWKRFVGTQMAEQIYDQTTINVAATGEKTYLLQARGEVEKFSGWKILYQSPKSPSPNVQDQAPSAESGNQLPKVKKGDPLQLIKVLPEQKFTQPPPAYTEATLIKALESRGIGRPSTYAPIISTIQDRGYVEKKEARFHATPVGLVVNDFLVKYFSDIIDYDFTREMEDDLDRIASGQRDWEEIIAAFFTPFEKKLDVVAAEARREKIPTEATGEKCPECLKKALAAEETGKQVIRSGRFGKFLSCSRFPECKWTETYVEKIGKPCPDCQASLAPNQRGEIVIKKTRKGKTFYGCSRYPKCKWASWRKPR